MGSHVSWAVLPFGALLMRLKPTRFFSMRADDTHTPDGHAREYPYCNISENPDRVDCKLQTGRIAINKLSEYEGPI